MNRYRQIAPFAWRIAIPSCLLLLVVAPISAVAASAADAMPAR